MVGRRNAKDIYGSRTPARGHRAGAHAEKIDDNSGKAILEASQLKDPPELDALTAPTLGQQVLIGSRSTSSLATNIWLRGAFRVTWLGLRYGCLRSIHRASRQPLTHKARQRLPLVVTAMGDL